jgi:formylglycine-generating enzyme required for sulfatase activity
VLLRLRVYPEGKTRDYRGERFAPRQTGGAAGEPAAPVSTVDTRLVRGGVDVTPSTEPQPLLTIDRLLRVQIVPGTVGSVRLVLRGACFGTMADLAAGETCLDAEDVRVARPNARLDPDMSVPRGSALLGTFDAEEACAGSTRTAGHADDGTPLHDEDTCIPGHAFIFGNRYDYGAGEDDGVPERVARVHAFYVDRYEMTVGRWRAIVQRAAAAGPLPPHVGEVILNEGALAVGSTNELDHALCSASAAKLGREELPLTCVTWRAARAICQLDGRDLPAEVQWEYAAQAAGRPRKTRYPWGDEALSCERAIFGRFALASQGRNSCATLGTGPGSVDADERPDGDVSPMGIVHLGGNVAEMARDAFFGLGSNCWAEAGLVEPSQGFAERPGQSPSALGMNAKSFEELRQRQPSRKGAE